MAYEIGVLKKKATEGFLLLGVKRVFVQAVFTTANIFLARLLFPADFGTYAIVSYLGAFIGVFSDLGFGAALIQRKKKLREIELQTAFTAQVLLGIFTIVLLNILAPFISNFFNIGDRGTLLLRLYSIYFLLGPFKSTSGAILERDLKYGKLVGIEIIEVFCASISTVILAILHFGVFSFVLGIVFGHIIGAVLYGLLSPWRVRFVIDKKCFIELSRFGIAYQSNAALGLVYGPLMLLYLGKQVGSESLGYFQFASSLSVLPLAVSEIVNRITFPLASRFQNNVTILKKVVERTISLVSAFVFPIVILGIIFARPVIHFVYTDKWLPALPMLYIGLVQIGILAYSGIFGQLLLSLGKVKFVRNISLLLAVITWIFGPILIAKFNVIGMSMVSLIVTLSGLVMMLQKRALLSFSLKFVIPYLAASLIAGLAVMLIRNFVADTLPILILTLGLGLVFYGAVIWFLKGKALFLNFRYLILALKRVNG